MGNANRKLLRDYGIAVAVAVLLAILIRIFVIEAYRIPSAAMHPTLRAGDTIFVLKYPFGLRVPGAAAPFTQGRAPERGEAVVFSSPQEPGREYIRRVVAVAGDTVALRGGRLLINGSAVSAAPDPDTGCARETLPRTPPHSICLEPPLLPDVGPEKVPAGSVFVLGDLRSASSDNRKLRTWGMIPVSALRGKAWMVWLSIEPASLGGDARKPRFRWNRMLKKVEELSLEADPAQPAPPKGASKEPKA